MREGGDEEGFGHPHGLELVRALWLLLPQRCPTFPWKKRAMDTLQSEIELDLNPDFLLVPV